MQKNIDLGEIAEMNQFFPGETAAEWAKKIEKALQSELLKMSNRDGSTVAHALASERRLPERFITPEILSLADRDGNAVVHILAEQGDLPEKYFTWEWLSLKNNDGWMAAHSAAWQGKLPAKFVTAEILELEGESGWITGNILLQRGNFPPEMLTVKFLEKPSFLIQLVFCFKYKDPEDRIQYAGLRYKQGRRREDCIYRPERRFHQRRPFHDRGGVRRLHQGDPSQVLCRHRRKRKKRRRADDEGVH